MIILSKNALNRCSNEDDWVRREIETAINSGCKIIPINPDGSFDGWPSSIPESIKVLTKQEISAVSMGSLFEKSIDKIEEERFVNVFENRKLPSRLHFLSFFLLYTIIGLINCYYCVKSMTFILDSKGLAWFCIPPFFLLFTFGMQYIYNSFDIRNYSNNPMVKYVMGIVCVLTFGLLLIVPSQTHALYYDFVAKEIVVDDLRTTQGYLQEIQNKDHIYDEEISNIKNLVEEIEEGILDVSNNEDIERIDSILLVGYSIIKNSPNVRFNSHKDEKRYLSDVPQTRIHSLTNVFEVWKLQVETGFSKEFILAMILSIFMAIVTALLFLKSVNYK